MTADELARRFEAETGIAVRQTDLNGATILMPVDDALGSFGILVGDPRDTVFRVRSYGEHVHLIVWSANEKKLDKALRRITGAA